MPSRRLFPAIAYSINSRQKVSTAISPGVIFDRCLQTCADGWRGSSAKECAAVLDHHALQVGPASQEGVSVASLPAGCCLQGFRSEI